MHLTSLCLFVYSLYCAALTVNPWKISWHGINGVLIINKEPDSDTFLLFLDDCREGIEAAHGRKSKQMRPNLRSKKTHLQVGQNKTKKGHPSLHCVMRPPRQHCSIKPWCGISSREKLQNSVHRHHRSFLPISISCGLPNTAPIQTCPHSQGRYCVFSGGKCWLTAQRRAYLVAWASWCSTGRHQVPSEPAPGHFISHQLWPDWNPCACMVLWSKCIMDKE